MTALLQSKRQYAMRVWDRALAAESILLDSTNFCGFWDAALEDFIACIVKPFNTAFRHATNFTFANAPDPISTLNLRSNISEDLFYVDGQHSHLFDSNGKISLRMLNFARTLVRGYARFGDLIKSDWPFLGLKSTEDSSATEIVTLGDLHGDGDCVRKITFSTGESLIYKPRSASVELAIEKLLGALSKKVDISVQVPKPVYATEDRSWWTPLMLLRNLDANDLFICESFARSFGQCLGVATLLGFEDLHYENIGLLQNGSLVIVDCETAFAYRSKNSQSDESCAEWGLLTEVSFRTGLLPALRILGDDIADDSLLTALVAKQQGHRSFWQSNYSSEFFSASALASYPANFFERFSEVARIGLLELANAITTHKALFADCKRIAREPRRFVYRPTRLYQRLLENAIVLEAFAGMDFEKSLWRELYETTVGDAPSIDDHAKMCRQELECLQTGVVPHFVFEGLPPSLTKGIAPLKDLLSVAKEQSGWIEVAETMATAVRGYGLLISCLGAASPDEYSVPISNEENLDKFFEKLSTNSVTLKNGQALIFDLLPTGTLSELTFGPTGLGLYRGAAGIGITLWAAEQRGCLHPRFRSRDFLLAGIEAIRCRHIQALSKSIGWSLADGIAGILYAICLSCMCPPNEILAQFEAALEDCDLESLVEWDYINGLAGVLASYSAIARRAEKKCIYPNAKRLAHRLDKIIRSENLLQVSLPNQRGLAHGLPGAWYALARARELAPTFFDFDNTIEEYRSAYCSNLPAEVNSFSWQNAETWCGGVFGTLRAEIRFSGGSVDVASRLRSVSAPHTSGVRQLCCGHQGAEIFAYEMQKLAEKDVSIDLSQDVVSFDQVDMNYKCLGFFQGIAGPLYYSLRSGSKYESVEMLD
jgi:hypothetical protein